MFRRFALLETWQISPPACMPVFAPRRLGACGDQLPTRCSHSKALCHARRAKASRLSSSLGCRRVRTKCSATTLEDAVRSGASSWQYPDSSSNGAGKSQEVRVRFAPSPTGNLHIGGARTALFNWLFAKHHDGKMILRIEDTDQSRSTKESEAAVLRDLQWLGLNWDEGPDIGGPYGPYRQSERLDIYKDYCNRLLEKDAIYRDFCTQEELTEMRELAEKECRPPIYTGKWKDADPQEVEDMLKKGTPHCFRCRVPVNQEIIVPDLVRGSVTFNSNSVGDFICLRSDGTPVYNFAVAVDDHMMKITHVLRAEEHLPNTLRQVIVNNYLFDDKDKPRSQFGHLSLILAKNRQKLSKRHGATSVGDFRNMGFLPEAMADYLSQMGWNDGTDQQFHTLDELKQSFSIERVGKSPAMFDLDKLSHTNGHYLRQKPREELYQIIGQEWVDVGLLSKQDTPFVRAAVDLLHTSLKIVKDADKGLRDALAYPLEETLATEDGQAFMNKSIAEEIIAAKDAGTLQASLESGPDTYTAWVKEIGKKHKVKGKNMWMPFRLFLTGALQGAELAPLMATLKLEDQDVKDRSVYVKLSDRVEILRKWLSSQ